MSNYLDPIAKVWGSTQFLMPLGQIEREKPEMVLFRKKVYKKSKSKQ